MNRRSLIYTFIAAVGCAHDNPGHDTSAAEPNRTPRAVPEAEARLAAYLRAVIVTEPQPEERFDTLMACLPENVSDPIFWLGAYRILSSERQESTVVASAEIITVAVETAGATRGVARHVTQRVKTDTLHWAMTKDSSGRWGVCGRSREGYDFGSYGKVGSMAFEPAGTSRRSILASVDSLRRRSR